MSKDNNKVLNLLIENLNHKINEFPHFFEEISQCTKCKLFKTKDENFHRMRTRENGDKKYYHKKCNSCKAEEYKIRNSAGKKEK